MADKVKFLKGTQTKYDALSTKDEDTFYHIDNNVYLGEIKLSNGEDVADLVIGGRNLILNSKDLSYTANVFFNSYLVNNSNTLTYNGSVLVY
jgi:hypothetical protein